MQATDVVPSGLEADLELIAEAARAGGEIAMRHFGRKHEIRMKPGDSPVTQADIAVDTYLRETLRKARPAYGWLSEETVDTPHRLGTQRLFVVDPIDGTRAFISGLPTWGVLIGLYHDGRPLIGVMDQPYLDERYRGWMDGAEVVARGAQRTLKTRACAGLGEATVSTTDPYLFHGEEAEAFARVRKAAKLARYGYDCYAYCMLAAGCIDCVIESGLKPFDIAALIPIVAGAGGGITSWSGGDASQGGRVLAWGAATVREEAKALLAG